MNIILGPTKPENVLTKCYENALRNAKELYIASAYLTNWSTKVNLYNRCENFLFLVGTDFGLTRKEACRNVLKWLPKLFVGNLLAVPRMSNGGFHPKIIAWKDIKNKFHCIIGSSNLTEAGMKDNYEANVEISIGGKEFARIKRWMEDIGNNCQVIDNDWLRQYNESKFEKKGSKANKAKPVVMLSIPDSPSYQEIIINRRNGEKAFTEISEDLLKAIIDCSSGKMKNIVFWDTFWSLWSKSSARLQGSGLQISGKKANWTQACKSVTNIISASSESELSLDKVVKEEIDKLAKLHSPVRGAWLTEMLCHLLPDRYPIINKPVKIWLHKNKWKSQRGMSEGGKYIDISRKLRNALKQNPNGPKSMPELDGVIWSWYVKETHPSSQPVS